MSRITRYALARAVAKVRAMDETQKEQLADQLFRAQPHVVASLLVQKQLGVSLEKMDFLIEILLICFQAMNESGLTWPLITEDEQERQMGRFVAGRNNAHAKRTLNGKAPMCLFPNRACTGSAGDP